MAQDDAIVGLLRARSPDGLRLLLRKWGPRVKGVLLNTFGAMREGMVDEALNEAAHRIWCSDGFDPGKGSLGAYFLTTARNAVLAALRCEAVQGHAEPMPPHALEPHLRPPRPAPVPRLLEDVMACVAELSQLQQRVVLADLRCSDGLAPARELAVQLHTSLNTIYVARSKAHRKLSRLLSERGHVLE